jgi:hypothetical protein
MVLRIRGGSTLALQPLTAPMSARKIAFAYVV